MKTAYLIDALGIIKDDNMVYYHQNAPLFQMPEGRSTASMLSSTIYSKLDWMLRTQNVLLLSLSLKCENNP